MQNLVQFRTTSDFDGEYLRNGLRSIAIPPAFGEKNVYKL